MKGAAFMFRMAARGLRAQGLRMASYVASVGLGVAALTAIASFKSGMEDAIRSQSRTLLGADAVISSRRPLPPALFQLLQGEPAERTEEIRFRSMIYVDSGDRGRLVMVRALRGAFPLYGALDVQPAASIEGWRRPGHLLVDDHLLLLLGSSAGDEATIGTTTFTIAGHLKKTPGDSPAEAIMAPRVFMNMEDLERTGLLRPGSVATYRLHLKYTGTGDASHWAEALRIRLQELNLSVETVKRREAELIRSTGNLADFLSLVGFTALLLAALGVASALHLYIRQRMNSVALLRCLGASSGSITGLFLLEAFVLALAGAIPGALLGVLARRLLPALLGDFLPVSPGSSLSAGAWLGSTLAGTAFTLLFAAIPLLASRRISPLAVLRRTDERTGLWRDPAVIVIALLISGALAWFAAAHMEKPAHGLGLALGIVILFAVLAALAAFLRHLARRLAGAALPYAARQAVMNLYRPRNQTVVMLVCIGFGLCLVTTMRLCERSLLGKLRIKDEGRQPNLVLIDLQPDECDSIRRLAEAAGMPPLHLEPIVAMRLEKLKDIPVQRLANDRSSGIPDWALQREYRSTYRSQLTATETLIAGSWSPDAPAPGQPISVSMEKSIAETLKLKLGDRLTFDVQGIPMETVVASIREVDWQSMQPNFYVIFPPGLLENAPHTFAFFTRARDAGQLAELLRGVARQHPQVTAIDLSMILESVNQIIRKIGEVVRLLALLTMAAGLLVTAGTLRSGRQHRQQEWALLRALGASRRQVSIMAAGEYLLLGALGALAGILLAMLASWPLTRWVFKTEWSLDLPFLAAAWAITTTLVVALGWFTAHRSGRVAPLELLREER